MIDELKSEIIVNKVGGRFKLTALIQKRLTELLQGARPLIEDTEGKTMLEIVVQEILRDKIAIEGTPLGEKPEGGDVEPGRQDRSER
jgi:DNA-directed RNA polymerase subunit omega